MKLRNLVLGLMLITTVFSAYGKSTDEDGIYGRSANVITVPAKITGGFLERGKELDIKDARGVCDHYARMFNKKCGKVVGFEHRYHQIYITYEFLDR